jgi:hypothetical protein
MGNSISHAREGGRFRASAIYINPSGKAAHRKNRKRIKTGDASIAKVNIPLEIPALV